MENLRTAPGRGRPSIEQTPPAEPFCATLTGGEHLGFVLLRPDPEGPVHPPVRMLGIIADLARHVEIEIVKLVSDLCTSPCKLIV